MKNTTIDITQMRDSNPASLELRLEARPDHASIVRQHVRCWLEEAGATRKQCFEITLAVIEAFNNAVQHPRNRTTSVVDVNGLIEDSMVTVTVRDTGCWRLADCSSGTGRGIPLMNVLMDAVGFEQNGDGTTVRMWRRL